MHNIDRTLMESNYGEYPGEAESSVKNAIPEYSEFCSPLLTADIPDRFKPSRIACRCWPDSSSGSQSHTSVAIEPPFGMVVRKPIFGGEMQRPDVDDG